MYSFTAVLSSLLHSKRQHLHQTLSGFHTNASEKAKAQIMHLQLKASGHKTGPVSTQECLISLVYHACTFFPDSRLGCRVKCSAWLLLHYWSGWVFDVTNCQAWKSFASYLPCRRIIHILYTPQQGIYLNFYHCLSKDVSLKMTLHDGLVECVSSRFFMGVLLNTVLQILKCCLPTYWIMRQNTVWRKVWRKLPSISHTV